MVGVAVLLFTVPVFEKNKEVFLLCFFNVYSFVLFPQWYFQGIQKMKIVTYIQLGLKLASLPLIFLLIKSPQNLILYVFNIKVKEGIPLLFELSLLFFL